MSAQLDPVPSGLPGPPATAANAPQELLGEPRRSLQLVTPGSAAPIQPDRERTSSPSQAGGAGFYDAAAIDRLAGETMRLARRNEALEDFAALVAHELKSPLEAALLADDPHRWISCALDLVESLLETAIATPDQAWASLAECVPEAARCLQPTLIVAVDETSRFPLPPSSLSVILRNLLANAAAAKAGRVNIFTAHWPDRHCLVVDDDGVGLGASEEGYDHGSGIGLELCRRIAGRNRGRLELVPRHAGGTRATLTLERAE